MLRWEQPQPWPLAGAIQPAATMDTAASPSPGISMLAARTSPPPTPGLAPESAFASPACPQPFLPFHPLSS